MLVLIRNCKKCEFTIFEEEAHRFTAADYNWELNKQDNLQGHNIQNNEHKFTWQPHGSQFTIMRNVPAHAKKFSIKAKIPKIDPNHILDLVDFNEDWIKIES